MRATLLLLLHLHSAAPFDTFPLDQLTFYAPSTLTPATTFRPALAFLPSLNAGLWAAANTTRAEAPFALPPHAPAAEVIVNTSAALQCTGALANMSASARSATLPTGLGYLGKYSGLARGFSECASLCCSTLACAALAYYDTSDQGPLCQLYAAGYGTGPQPFPAGAVLYAQGAALTTPPPAGDDIANGLRSGTHLGGLGTGGYEVRADGTFHLSTIRNQSPASEPWQGTLRDCVLAVALGASAFVVGLKPLFGLSPLPQLVYEDAFPVAKFSLLGSLRLYAYTTLRPGDSNASNTPAVVFTLHVTNANASAGAPPLNVTFVVAQGLGLRSDFHAGVTSPPLQGAFANASACAAACAAATAPPCLAWQFNAQAATCSLESTTLPLGANAAGIDSGFPGTFSSSGGGTGLPWVVFETLPPPPGVRLHNALGSQGLFVLPGSAPASGVLSAGVAVGESMEALLAPLVALGSAAVFGSGSKSGGGDLFAAAAASVHGLLPGDSAALSITHAWHFPIFLWYRDAFNGSDIGVRYAGTFLTVHDVVASLNLTDTAAALVAWQGVYAGLPHPLLRDAAHNTLAHLRSSMWHASGEYRQWESFEFTDWGNPTNGDERHLPYLGLAPDTMRSQLLTWVAHAQNSDGSFYCIIVSGAGDAQYGRGDPCAHAPPHPDDVSMVLIAAYEQLVLRNDSALIYSIYPSLLRAFEYYSATYNTSQWYLPYKVHETYDAVAERAGTTGEGNLGTSLFNALEYLTGLLCMAGLAEHVGDAPTAAAAAAMAALAQAAIQRNLFQPNASTYIGDTLDGNAYLLTEPNGYPYKSSDGLHGAVLAQRLGFGDLLPRLQMQLHQNHIRTDLATAYGLRFDTYSAQNWLMGDHAASALALHWNEAGAWEPALLQLDYFRNVKRDATRHTAVVDTGTGGYGLLNYYGYALFFHHTLHGFSGQVAHLPQRRLAFSPHYSAFDNVTGAALLPIVLAGSLGTLALTPSSAVLRLAFADVGAPQPLSFLNITICQHVFVAQAAAPWVLQVGGQALSFALPAPCATSAPASVSRIGTTEFCSLCSQSWDNTTAFAWLPAAPAAAPLALSECQRLAVAHRYCGYQWSNSSNSSSSSSNSSSSGAVGACWLVPGGSTCALLPAAAPPGTPLRALGRVRCDFSAVYTPPQVVNVSEIEVVERSVFGGGFVALDSAVYTFVVAEGGLGACTAAAQAAQACGAVFVPSLGGGGLGGSCVGGGQACCVLNPYKGCSVEGEGTAPLVWGNATLVRFGNAGVLPSSAGPAAKSET